MSEVPPEAPPAKKARHEGGSKLPPGWIECPPMGEPLGLFVPMKAPMDTRHDGEIPSDRRFTPAMAVQAAESLEWHNPLKQNLKVKFSGVGLVIDLSKARSFYDSKLWERMGIKYYKLPCLGHQGAPGPEDVNEFIYVVSQLYTQLAEANKCILVHCTHGYNRTGFMLASYWLRMHDVFPYLSAAHWITTFAHVRGPGIYKEEYVSELFRRANEVMPKGFAAAPLPDWKPEDEEDEIGDVPGRPDAHPDSEELRHDDIYRIGERIMEEEANQMRSELATAIWGKGRERMSSAATAGKIPVPDFPGSHPVSLDRENLERVREKDYMVTWKADGTRYLMLIAGYSVYLIDRKFDIARVPIRFLRYVEAKDRKATAGLKFGTFHSNTLLDGEMVVDDDVVNGTMRRRFLIYDLMMLNGQNLMREPFRDRYEKIDREILHPRMAEREMCERGMLKYHYDYNLEPFSVRRKGFYPLTESRKLIEKVIPTLTHESDGLIFQGAADAYVPGTFDDLLKWKFTHLNSVDLLLKITERGKVQLNTIDNSGLVPVDYELFFPNEEDPAFFHNKVVECTWDNDLKRFIFLRERIDKTAPNGRRVFEKVMKSIEDDINEEFLLSFVERAVEERKAKGLGVGELKGPPSQGRTGGAAGPGAEARKGQLAAAAVPALVKQRPPPVAPRPAASITTVEPLKKLKAIGPGASGK